MKPGQLIGPGRYNYGRDLPEWKKPKAKKQEETNEDESKLTVAELIKEILDSYDSTDIVLKYSIKVKTPFSKRTITYPQK